jgi:hypothetical protein
MIDDTHTEIRTVSVGSIGAELRWRLAPTTHRDSDERRFDQCMRFISCAAGNTFATLSQMKALESKDRDKVYRQACAEEVDLRQIVFDAEYLAKVNTADLVAQSAHWGSDS